MRLEPSPPRCPGPDVPLRQHGGSPTLKSRRCGNANPCSTSEVRDISRGSTVQAAHSPGACGPHIGLPSPASLLLRSLSSMEMEAWGGGGGGWPAPIPIAKGTRRLAPVQRCQGRKRGRPDVHVLRDVPFCELPTGPDLARYLPSLPFDVSSRRSPFFPFCPHISLPRVSLPFLPPVVNSLSHINPARLVFAHALADFWLSHTPGPRETP
jgi:hypothetical protein